MPKKASQVPTQMVHIRMTITKVKAIDELVVRSGDFKDRTEFINRAVDHYLERVQLDLAGLRMYYIQDGRLEEKRGFPPQNE
jgi:Arc/MetJ-type ribon-helix-helix transcriptional regulator